ncbi:MAG: hypothetical protein Q8O92_05290 [Candidatus Latescibacter sp.]|nr:hypothetical protein [Candidatus Latescibacter sp.]
MLQAAAFGLFALWTEPPGFLLSAVLFGLTAWSIPAIMAAACGDVLGAIADTTGSFDPAFLLAGIVALLGAAGSLFLKT